MHPLFEVLKWLLIHRTLPSYFLNAFYYNALLSNAVYSVWRVGRFKGHFSENHSEYKNSTVIYSNEFVNMYQAWTRAEARLHVGIKHEPGLKQGYMLESSMNQGWSKATCWKNNMLTIYPLLFPPRTGNL